MRRPYRVALDAVMLALPLGSGVMALAQTAELARAPGTRAESSSGPALQKAPATDETARATAGLAGGVMEAPQRGPIGMQPFSAVAMGVQAGLSGVGLEVATPLARRLNLRAGGSFVSVDPTFVEDGISVVGDIHLQSGFVAVDVFPFHGGFHLSPGFTLYNGDHLSAKALVPGGQDFDLGDGTYTSDTTDPVHGTFDLSFGKKSGPRLTLGWGNMIPREGGHWSFLFEFGAEYIGKPPQVTLTLAGTVCQGPGFCQTIDQNVTARQNVAIEQNEINSDIPSWLRFFPLVSTGLSYRFGNSPSSRR